MLKGNAKTNVKEREHGFWFNWIPSFPRDKQGLMRGEGLDYGVEQSIVLNQLTLQCLVKASTAVYT